VSKGNSAIKVLKTGLNRVHKGWTQGKWSYTDHQTGQTFVCLEGALYGYCDAGKHQLTKAQIEARDVVLGVIRDRYNGQFATIPDFNDTPGRVQEEIEEVIKLGIIRLETGGDDDYLTDEDVDSLLSSKRK